MSNRVRVIAAAIAVALSACSSGETAETTEPPASTSTTTAAVTTTIEAPPTTTTSTLAGSTTTTLPGNWAELPVVTSASANLTLGWWDGTTWVEVEDGMDLPVTGGEDYQIALLGTEDSRTTGGPRITGCDIYGPDVDIPGIELADPDLLSIDLEDDASGRFQLFGVAVSAPWDITPRPTATVEASAEIQNAAFDLLTEAGFTTDEVIFVQTLESDLDGDGAPETLVVAESTEVANQASGVYSLVFAVSPSWETPVVVAASVIPATEEGFPESYRVSAVADLNGDGTMEVVVDGLAWETIWHGVYELTNEGFEPRIGAGCGS